MIIKQDIPLDNISQDKLSRENIINLIVDSINSQVSSDHPCLVYGIYGKWGEGKTSIMNFVKHRLIEQGKNDGISLVEFSPWIVDNSEALLREFFNSIVSFPDRNVRKLFKKYGKHAILTSKTIMNVLAPGVESALATGISMIQNAFKGSQDTLTEMKHKVSDAIKKSGHHLIVMIDDVDRLDRDELHTLFRVIRQVADFHNCIYIIAMDAEMVSKAISDYYGNAQDGRKFIDKIVQVPIVLPQIPEVDMRELVQKELTVILSEYVDNEQISTITGQVTPFLCTVRNIIRYCNQLSFVLPHLRDEVNINDLCLLEAIKNVSGEAFDRIYESRSSLFKESDSVNSLIEPDKSVEVTEKNYSSAKEYITENLCGKMKKVVLSAIDQLFGNRSIKHQQDIDNKRIMTNEYFAKYFVQKVPGDIIPDRVIDELNDFVKNGRIDYITSKINEWLEGYAVSEIKRAVIRLIRQFEYGQSQNMAASVLSKSLSVCKLAKGLPEHTYLNEDDISTFVPVAIIKRYMFVQIEDFAGVRVLDAKTLDDTLDFIFKQAELNYCMNFMASSDVLFNTYYDGHNPIAVLINRFKALDFNGQFKYSKFLLTTLFIWWNKIDEVSFNEYARNMFSNPEIPYLTVFDKLIDGTENQKDTNIFLRLFHLHVPIINERINNDVKGEPHKHDSIKVYLSNYRIIIDNLGLKV